MFFFLLVDSCSAGRISAVVFSFFFFFFKQKTAYEMRISDWSSDVCSSDLSAVQIPREFDIGKGFFRLTTLVVVLPRIVLAELNTHRLLSRNSEIGRASCRERVCQYV